MEDLCLYRYAALKIRENFCSWLECTMVYLVKYLIFLHDSTPSRCLSITFTLLVDLSMLIYYLGLYHFAPKKCHVLTTLTIFISIYIYLYLLNSCWINKVLILYVPRLSKRNKNKIHIWNPILSFSPWISFRVFVYPPFSFYIRPFQMTEYLSPGRVLSVRLSVCVSVCVCVCLSITAFHLNTIRPILIKLGPHNLIRILRWCFTQIWKCCSDDVIAALLYVFKWGTLTVAILLRSSSKL